MATGAQSSSVDFSSAQDSVREHAKGVLSARRNEIHRSLQVSEQCKTESEAIYLDSSYSSAFAALESQVESAIDINDCVDSGNNVLTCDFDYASVDVSNLKSICASLSGQDTTIDFYLKCTIQADGQTGTLVANFKNLYDCLGASCDPANLSGEIEKLGTEINSVFQSQGFSCEFGAGSGVGSLTVSTAILGTMAMFLAMM